MPIQHRNHAAMGGALRSQIEQYQNHPSGLPIGPSGGEHRITTGDQQLNQPRPPLGGLPLGGHIPQVDPIGGLPHPSGLPVGRISTGDQQLNQGQHPIGSFGPPPGGHPQGGHIPNVDPIGGIPGKPILSGSPLPQMAGPANPQQQAMLGAFGGLLRG